MTHPNVRVLVLIGGPDHERPVSLLSGRAVAAALRGAGRFDVSTFDIVRPEEFALELRSILRTADVVFPVLHGRWGEGGSLQRMLEEAGAAFVGCHSEAAALAMDKVRTRDRAVLAGITVPEGAVIDANDRCPIAPPLVLKPIDEGSSINLRVVHDARTLHAARVELHPRVGPLLAERYVRGREITAGIVHGVPLPLIEIMPATPLYDYAAKYERTDTRYSMNPDIPAAAAHRCREITRTLWSLLDLRDLARADFIVDEQGRPWFLEINTMPGFTSHSLLPMAAAHAGLSMSQLCASLVDAALRRHALATGSSNHAAPPSRSTSPWPEPVLDAPVPHPIPRSTD